MNKIVIAGFIAIVIYLTVRTVNKPSLKYFSPIEFGAWYPFMSNDLLQKLDAFRAAWGYPVVISSADGAIGRKESAEETSQHNFTRWGEVRAIDIFPQVGGGKYITTAAQRRRALDVARSVGFTGIGLYTDTARGNMLHVDVRVDRSPGSPALWSRVNGSYGSISDVLV